VEGYLVVFLRILRAYVIRRVVILGTDGKDGEQDRKPGRRYGFGCRRYTLSILGALFKIQHQLGLEVFEVDDDAPEGLSDFLVRPEQSSIGEKVSF
jgi:hypothetical protein